MYLDMSKYNIEDLKDEKEKAFIEGHAEALEDLESALDNYLADLPDENIKIIAGLKEQIASDFVRYAKDYIRFCNDTMIINALDRQGE